VPTYKYSNGGFEAEVSGWPDRIWYSTNNKIICSKYGVMEEMRDNHVPVIGWFQVEVDEIDEEKKSAVMEELVRKVSEAEHMDDFESFEKLENNNTEIVETENTPLN
jgi:hypothetical protein